VLSRLDARRRRVSSIAPSGSGSLAAFVPLQSQKATVTLTAATVFPNAFENDALGPIYADKIRNREPDFPRSPARLFSRNQL
jgi:hypothetical protein